METVSVLYPEGEAREMVFAYMEDIFGVRRHTHIIEPERALPDEAARKALTDFARMASGEPLQYVTGKAHFYGRQFRVTPDVLIPRQETELLCNEATSLLNAIEANNSVYSMEAVCQRCVDGIFAPPRRGRGPAIAGRGPSEHLASAVFGTIGHTPDILDMCTGSGCIAWTLALEMPGTKVTAVDISDGALSVASSQDFSEEISRTGALKPRFIKADVLKDPEDCPELCPIGGVGKFDIIVSNPPYVMDSEKAAMRINVLDHEPHLALFVPDDDPLKFYKAVSEWSVKLLKDDGFGIVEINETLGEETAGLFRTAGFGHAEIIRDLHGKDRFVRFSRKESFQKKRFF